jgi:hypothetical protein
MLTQELVPPPAALTQPWRLPPRGLAVFHGECDTPRLSHYFMPRLVLEGKRILFLDGANCVNPRLMARLAERRGIPFAQFNRQIKLARAFTCFQLTELISRVPQFLAEFPAQVLMVTAFPELYFDEDVRPADASAAFQRALEHLRRWGLYQPVQGWAGEGVGLRQSRGWHTPYESHAGRDPSPVPRRLVKAPVAVHPLPLGEGEKSPFQPSPRGEGARRRSDFGTPTESIRLQKSERAGEGSFPAPTDFDAAQDCGAQDLTVAVFSCAANFHPPAGRKLFFTQTCAAATELWKFQVDEHGRLGLMRQAKALGNREWGIANRELEQGIGSRESGR